MQTELTGASCSGERYRNQQTPLEKEQQQLEHGYRTRFTFRKLMHIRNKHSTTWRLNDCRFEFSDKLVSALSRSPQALLLMVIVSKRVKNCSTSPLIFHGQISRGYEGTEIKMECLLSPRRSSFSPTRLNMNDCRWSRRLPSQSPLETASIKDALVHENCFRRRGSGALASQQEADGDVELRRAAPSSTHLPLRQQLRSPVATAAGSHLLNPWHRRLRRC